MKKLLIALAVVLVIVVAGFFAVAFSLGSIVKGGVNRVGPELTKSEVHLDGAQVSPFTGHGTLTNLTVANPAGYSSEKAFSLGRITIDVDPGSLMGDHIIVRSVVIQEPEIVYENRLTSSNLQEIMKNIQEAAGGGGQTTTEGGKPVRIEVQNFRMQNAKITAIAAGNRGTVVMPDLVLQNLGTNEGGLTPQQLAVAVMKEVTAQAVQAGARAAIDKGVLQKGLDQLLGGKKKE